MVLCQEDGRCCWRAIYTWGQECEIYKCNDFMKAVLGGLRSMLGGGLPFMRRTTQEIRSYFYSDLMWDAPRGDMPKS